MSEVRPCLRFVPPTRSEVDDRIGGDSNPKKNDFLMSKGIEAAIENGMLVAREVGYFSAVLKTAATVPLTFLCGF